jgi:capsular exopolysaccharide synthesis family protein
MLTAPDGGSSMTTAPGAGPTLRSYSRLIRRRKWWVGGLTLLGVAVGISAPLAQARQYTSTAQILVQGSTGPTALGAAPQQVTTTEVQTMLQLVTSASVQRAVRHKLGSAPPVQATEIAQTNVIAISAVAGTPGAAARIANAYAGQFAQSQQAAAIQSALSSEAAVRGEIAADAREVTKLRAQGRPASQVNAVVNQQAVLEVQLSQLQLNSAGQAAPLTVVTPAVPPLAPSSPRPVQDALLGLVAGLALGLAAAFLRHSLDDAVSSKETVEQLTNASVLAAVPMVTSWRKRDRPLVVTLARPPSPATEAYRSLRTSLQFARAEHELRTILVTSPAAAEGKTSTLANLGAVFAQAGQSVLMVSCDLRKPRLGQFFGIDETAGLTTAILGEDVVENLIRPAPGTDGLWLLPSGPTPPNPAELLNGARSQQIFARLRDSFDLVLIDSPPVLPVTDAAVLSKDADATLLVVAAFRTRSGDLLRASEKLAQVNARVVGVVLNEATRQAAGYYSTYGSRQGYYGTPLLEPAPNVLARSNGYGNGNGSAASRNGASVPRPADPGGQRRGRHGQV